MQLASDLRLLKKKLPALQKAFKNFDPESLSRMRSIKSVLDVFNNERKANCCFARQVDMPLDYDGVLLDCGYRADIVVRNEVLLKIKSIERILPVHEAQLLTYLRLSSCRIGLLLNFNTVSLKDGIRRRVL
jgi:GxxExxY protein